MSEENKAIARRVHMDIYVQGKLSVVDEIFAPDAVMYQGGQVIRGPEAIKQNVATYRSALTDMKGTVEDEIAMGDKVVTRWTASGTQTGELMGIPPTNKPWTMTGINIVRIEHGKIVESRSEFDRLGLVRQLSEQIVELKGNLAERNRQLEAQLIELRQTQGQLIQSEKMAALGKLVAGIVHELNTPIGAINSATDVLSRSISSLQEVLSSSQTLDELRDSRRFAACVKGLNEGISASEAASRRIGGIIGSLKSFARIDEGPFQTADIHEGLESTLTLIEPHFQQRIRVERQYGDLPQLSCYPAELNQVFFHLLMNATQAIPEDGVISIRTFVDGGKAYVQVSDDGIGIPPEQVQHLFDPAFSKKGSRVRMGVGLFASFNIVQKHHGEISVESQVGRGSTFTISVPLDLRPSQA